ncbi:Armadillo-type fold [Pseudocohnilembus persalinus]|uniref:Armadillo-type fold n=1 Tax=Pseudocohnilembus persalinus TaxID=266149 RepID=A0A0V0R8Z7_PSEPJ|nr:Armadillo-type fold [Pseudocohnilembus persalinus]|eukprot:KRX10959.1 Armadillo-type fold [Pseudocohnilembus persalinus]
MPVNFPLVLKQLDTKNYPQQELRDFFKEAGLYIILMKYQAGSQYTKKLMARILQDETLFDKIIFPEEEKEQKILTKLFDKEDFKLLLSQAIKNNYKFVAEKLNNFYESNKEQYEHYIKVIISLISEQDSDTSLNIVNAISKMLSKEIIKFTKDEIFIALLQEGMEHKDDIIRMRYMEIVMEVSNSSEEAHNFLQSKQILDKCIQQVVTDDILLRLAAVEVISKMGNKKYNSKFLAEHEQMKKIISDAFNPKEELYVKKYLALLISKLLSNGTMELSVHMRNNFINLLTQLFFEGQEEGFYAAMDIISHLVQTQEGINLVISKEEIFTAYMSMGESTKEQIRMKFIGSFASFFQKNPFSEKSHKVLSNCMICFGNLKKVHLTIDFHQAPQTLDDLQPAMDKIFNLLYQPFPEQEIELLYLIRNIISWEILCKRFIGHQKVLDYLTLNFAKNGEILDMKQTIIKELLDLCENVFNKEHVVFKKFAETLKKALAEAKEKQKEKRLQEMEYGISNL